MNAKETAAGLTLARPLYKLLAEYEKNNLDFSAYLPIMLDRLPKHTPW